MVIDSADMRYGWVVDKNPQDEYRRGSDPRDPFPPIARTRLNARRRFSGASSYSYIETSKPRICGLLGLRRLAATPAQRLPADLSG